MTADSPPISIPASIVVVTLSKSISSTALLLEGFGLKDAVNDVVEFNYNNVFVYDRMIYLKDNYDNGTIMNLLNNNINILKRVLILNNRNIISNIAYI